MTTAAPKTFLILQERLPEMMEALGKLQKRAARHGLTEAMYTIGDLVFEERTYTDWNGDTATTEVPLLQIHLAAGAPIKVAGWTFLARLERVGDTNLIQTVPGFEGLVDIDRWAHAASHCDHCNVNRFRKDTFVVANDDGQQKQVGSTCLRDFLGCDLPEKIIARFNYMKLVSDRLGQGEGGWIAPSTSLIAFMSGVATLTRVRGFASKAYCQKVEEKGGFLEPTSSLLSSAIWSNSEEAEAIRKEIRDNRTPADVVQAHAVIDYWANATGDNEYTHNLVALMKQDTVSSKHAGIVASAISAWARATNTHIGPAKDEPTVPSEFVGTVGERLRKVDMKVIDKKTIESHYGFTTLVKMRDLKGNDFTWFASNSRDFQVGETMKVTGTVKKHEDFRGRKQTVLSRCVTA